MTESTQIDPALQEMQAAADVFAEGRYADAVVLAQNFTARFPEHAFGWKLLGSAYGQMDQYAQAFEALKQAISIRPDDVEVHSNLALFQDRIGQVEAAIESYRSALEITPDSAEAHNQFGSFFSRLGNLEEASASFSRAIQIDPDYQLAIFNLGVTLLTQGKYNEGWPNFESRRAAVSNEAKASVQQLPFPRWNGEPLEGKSLLLWPEQGFGDYVQFIRYASLLKDRGVSRLTVRCSAALRDLLATAAGVDEVITHADPVPPHDYWSFPLSLPLRFGTTLESIPVGPYLRASPELRERWRYRLPLGGFKVGLVWKGSSAHSNDAHRSLPALDVLRPLWNVPGITFVSLQKGAGEEDAATSGLPIAHLGSEIRDFADTAAIIDQLDLVICVDTAIAHVAGALGKPCWVLLPAIGCDWRWLRDRSDSPWYPGALRLFRQKEQGDWSSVIAEVAINLRERVG